jgi:hypothetical protein
MGLSYSLFEQEGSGFPSQYFFAGEKPVCRFGTFACVCINLLKHEPFYVRLHLHPSIHSSIQYEYNSITTASCNVSCSPAYYSTLDRIEKYLRTECTIRYWACGYQMCIKRTFVKGRGAADAKMGMVHYAKKKPRDGQKTKPHSCYHENYQHLQSL